MSDSRSKMYKIFPARGLGGTHQSPTLEPYEFFLRGLGGPLMHVYQLSMHESTDKRRMSQAAGTHYKVDNSFI